jgi:hypothetical protein
MVAEVLALEHLKAEPAALQLRPFTVMTLDKPGGSYPKD